MRIQAEKINGVAQYYDLPQTFFDGLPPYDGLTPNERMVYARIWSWGKWTESAQKLADGLCMSRATAVRSIRTLIARGLLYKTGKGSGTPSIYQVVLPNADDGMWS